MMKKFWTFRAAADDPKIGELLLYGEISSYSWWGDEVTPKQFKEELDAMGDVDIIKVFINSPGGDLFAGQAILSMLKRHSATVEVYIDGLAASAASVVAMAGDTVYMPRNAMIMIHNPWSWGMGFAEDFRKLADDLDKARETIIAAYQTKTGLDREKIAELLDAETWMTADEALDLGFIDEVEEEKQIAASLRDGRLIVNEQEMDLSRFKNPPKLFVSPEVPAEPEPPPAEPEPQNTEPPAEPNIQEAEQAKSLLSLYSTKVRVNQNRLRRF